MINLPDPGLYRTTKAYPGHEDDIPANTLVYVGDPPGGEGLRFVVRPGANRKNQWFWGEPTIPLRSTIWAQTLKKIPSEGFYTLPEDLHLDGGGVWRRNAIVQLGYNGKGQGIVFVGERHDVDEKNLLQFSDKGLMVDDDLLFRLVWAPILPVRQGQ
jgi:hypothetical protein